MIEALFKLAFYLFVFGSFLAAFIFLMYMTQGRSKGE